jgi:precorrin-3B methylase
MAALPTYLSWPLLFHPSGVTGVCAGACCRRVGAGLILKFNLLSLSHREKEWEQVSKNSLACQNC